MNNSEEYSMEQLVTFSLNNESFAFPINIMQEIVRVPNVTTVPQAADCVRGISNLRGNILPIIDMRTRLNMEPIEDDDRTRVVVIKVAGNVFGCVVESVSSVARLEKDTIEAPPETVAGMDGQNLLGITRLSDDNLTMILDPMKIMPEDVPLVDLPTGSTSSESSSAIADNTIMHEEELLVLFTIGTEEFGVDIMEVQEIIRVDEITVVPRAPSFVKGVVTLREHLLPIIDLRTKFSMTDFDAEFSDNEDYQEKLDDRRIVVVNIGGMLTGIIVDSVSEVLRLAKSKIDPPPAILSADEQSRLKGVGKVGEGERIVMLLEAGKLISEEEKEIVRKAGDGEDMSIGAGQDLDGMVDEKQFVCFELNKESYALDIMNVQEIIRCSNITDVPQAPGFVEGIINLRGNVLPVIDMRTRFSMGTAEKNDATRIIVAKFDGRVTGFIVDRVTEVLRVPISQIEDAPAIVSGSAENKFLDGIAKLDGGKKILIVIDIQKVMNVEESDMLEEKFPESKVEEEVVDDVVEEVVDDVVESIEASVEAAEEKPKLAVPPPKKKTYSQMTKDELLAEAAKKGIEADSSMTKKNIIAAIKS